MRKLELEIISDIDLNNKIKTIKKDTLIKKLFDLDIIELEQYINPKTGKDIKKYSSVNYNNIWYKVNKPYEDLKKLIQDRSIPVLGFAYKSKRYK